MTSKLLGGFVIGFIMGVLMTYGTLRNEPPPSKTDIQNKMDSVSKINQELKFLIIQKQTQKLLKEWEELQQYIVRNHFGCVC